MPDDKLSIGAVIDLSQILPGLDRLASSTEATATRMAASFGGLNAIQISPGQLEAYEQQVAKIADLESAAMRLRAGLQETKTIIQESGGAMNVGASITQQYAREQLALALVEKQLAAAKAELKTMTNEIAAAQTRAAAATTQTVAVEQQAAVAAQATSSAEQAVAVSLEERTAQTLAMLVAQKQELAATEEGMALLRAHAAATAESNAIGLESLTNAAGAKANLESLNAAREKQTATLKAVDAAEQQLINSQNASAATQAGLSAEQLAGVGVSTQQVAALEAVSSKQDDAIGSAQALYMQFRAQGMGANEASAKVQSLIGAQATASEQQQVLVRATLENRVAQEQLRQTLQGVSQTSALTGAQIDGIAQAQARASVAAAALNAAQRTVSGSTQQTITDYQAASMALGSLRGSTFMMERGLARVATESTFVSKALQLAFPIFGAIAFVTILSELITKIIEYQAELLKVQREQNDLAISTIGAASAMEMQNLKLGDQIAKLEGRPSTNQLAIALEEAKERGEQLSRTLEQSLLKARELLSYDFFTSMGKALVAGGGDVAVATNRLAMQWSIVHALKSAYNEASEAILNLRMEMALATAGSKQHEDAVQAMIKQHQQLADTMLIGSVAAGNTEAQSRAAKLAYLQEMGAVASLTQYLENLRLTREAADKGVSRESLDRYVALQTAQLTAEKNLQLARIEETEANARRRRALGEISLDDEIAALEAAEAKKLAIITRFNEAHKRLLTRYGPEKAPEVARITGEQAVQEEKSQSAVNNIRGSGAAERKRIDEAAALAEIEAAKRKGAATQELEETHQKALTALSVLSIEEEKRQTQASEQARYEREHKALEGRLALAEKEPERKKAEIIALHADLEALEKTHQAKRLQIDADADRKLMEQRRRAKEEAIAIELGGNLGQIDAERTRADLLYDMRQISRAQRYQLERDFESREYTLQLEAVRRRQALYRQDPEEYARIGREIERLQQDHNRKLSDIDLRYQRERLQRWINLSHEIESSMASSISQMLSGQKSFADGMASIWNGIVMAVINMLAAMVAEFITTHIIMAVLSKIFKKQMQFDTAAAAAGEISSKAGVAGAAGFASVMAALPFPENVIVAPAVMAAAVATTLSNLALVGVGVADKGGILDSDMIVQAHKEEMILPPNISTALQSAIERGTFTRGEQVIRVEMGAGGDRSFGFTYAPTVQAIDSRGMAQVLERHSGLLEGQIKRIIRRKNLA